MTLCCHLTPPMSTVPSATYHEEQCKLNGSTAKCSRGRAAYLWGSKLLPSGTCGDHEDREVEGECPKTPLVLPELSLHRDVRRKGPNLSFSRHAPFRFSFLCSPPSLLSVGVPAPFLLSSRSLLLLMVLCCGVVTCTCIGRCLIPHCDLALLTKRCARTAMA